jgi:hypothetical protein
MTPVARLLRNAAERFADKYYEGPQPPERLLALVVEFANHNPKATRADWVAFCKRMAGQAYRDGYQRGYEYVERDEQPSYKKLPPEMVAAQEDPDWEWSPPLGPDLELPDDQPEEFEPGELAPEREARHEAERE